MLRQIDPRLRRSDVMINSFCSCVSNAPEECSSTPEVSFSEILPQPRMFVQKFKGTVSFKQLKGFADTNCCWKFDKQVDMVDSNMQLVDFTIPLDSNLSYESFTINFDPIELKGVHSVFRFPHEVEGILPKFMTKAFQIHFFPPKLAGGDKAHANFVLFQEPNIWALHANGLTELNFIGATALLPSLKARVSEPQDM